MIHFINQYNADSGETGAALLSAELGKPYDDLKEDNLPSIELVEKSFSVIESLPYFQAIKHDFVAMNIFDLLIGNQDRHPFNWQILFKGNKHFFRSEEHTSELQSRGHLVCRLLLEKKNKKRKHTYRQL